MESLKSRARPATGGYVVTIWLLLLVLLSAGVLALVEWAFINIAATVTSFYESPDVTCTATSTLTMVALADQASAMTIYLTWCCMSVLNCTKCSCCSHCTDNCGDCKYCNCY